MVSGLLILNGLFLTIKRFLYKLLSNDINETDFQSEIKNKLLQGVS